MIREIRQEKKAYLDLLLLADPYEKMLDQYLEAGECWMLEEENKEPIAIAVVLPLSEQQCELKNLAVKEAYQRQGYGTRLVQALLDRYKNLFSEMLVGTADSGIAYYEKLGFCYSHTVKNFFVLHYPEPIWDDGKQCIDMYYFKRPL